MDSCQLWLSCPGQRQLVKVDLLRCLAVKSRVWTPSIVELEVSPERGPGPTDRFIAYEIHLLVLESSPPAFDEGIVPPASFAVHGGADTIDFEQVGKSLRSELRALIGSEDLRCTIVVDGFLGRCQAGCCAQNIRYPPGQHLAGIPIDDHSQIDKTSGHRKIGDIRRPDLIGPLYTHMAQRISQRPGPDRGVFQLQFVDQRRHGETLI